MDGCWRSAGHSAGAKAAWLGSWCRCLLVTPVCVGEGARPACAAGVASMGLKFIQLELIFLLNSRVWVRPDLGATVFS
jgi:hypothetical protein